MLSLLALLIISYSSSIAGQNCGITGIPPGSTIVNPYVIPDTFPIKEIIWKSATYNVIKGEVTPHPHTKYIDGLRYSTSYSYVVAPQMINFIKDTGENVILRNITYTCVDNSTLQYYFQFPIEISDKNKPKFQHSNYTFEITKDWVEEVPINLYNHIMVGDDDPDFVNANLSFYITPNTLPLRLESTPLWNDAPNPNYYYIVNIFLKPGVQINVGTYEFVLTAASRYQVGSTDINLIVV